MINTLTARAARSSQSYIDELYALSFADIETVVVEETVADEVGFWLAGERFEIRAITPTSWLDRLRGKYNLCVTRKEIDPESRIGLFSSLGGGGGGGGRLADDDIAVKYLAARSSGEILATTDQKWLFDRVQQALTNSEPLVLPVEGLDRLDRKDLERLVADIVKEKNVSVESSALREVLRTIRIITRNKKT